MPDPVLSPAPRRSFPTLTVAALAGTVLLAAGCAQQRSQGYYNPPAASTTTDAQYQGEGAGYRPVVRAPSQLQIELKAPPPGQTRGRTDAEDAAAAKATESSADAAAEAAGSVSPAAHALVPQPQTYMGTLPCLTPSPQCAAQRVTLTLAPNGRWRSRIAYLDSAGNLGKPSAEQGCWDATAERPPRVLLAGADGTQRIELIVAANNVLRVKSVLGKSPNLNYSLTRQPDLDAIDELSGQPAPKCL
ncbi:copper resistance protein NlpE N-terminal domain-containing protein [Bordetella petrii]|uniref:Lipoprotein n=1 Tax=Bordetella petrii (strain ATCC BAA-461 / DSM 12804 / CCUG 43448 / CIP 107267 / Se-1111R) TaxID=340100 RepID=A9I1H8_BORPD|nr:copper resistance protein NlpE N-terminal domain-containing protein [Bordetella petrii]CAP40863.1 putative lipoprotein [Bordetella petrii]